MTQEAAPTTQRPRPNGATASTEACHPKAGAAKAGTRPPGACPRWQAGQRRLEPQVPSCQEER